MHRHALTDEQWDKLQKVLPRTRPGPKSGIGERLFIDAVLYRVKTGVAWRDLPERFGPWKSIYNRFSRWARLGLWAEIFKALQMKIDKRGSILDSSVVRAHQDAAGGKGGANEMLWAALEEVFQPSSMPSSTRKRGRSTSRYLLLHAQGRALIADTGYDAGPLVDQARRKGMKVVICSQPTRKTRRRIDRRLYRRRYLVEIFFHQLKRFRGIATRYEKTARNYLALVQLACVWLWLS